MTYHGSSINVSRKVPVGELSLRWEGVVLKPVEQRKVQVDPVVGELRGVDVRVHEARHQELARSGGGRKGGGGKGRGAGGGERKRGRRREMKRKRRREKKRRRRRERGGGKGRGEKKQEEEEKNKERGKEEQEKCIMNVHIYLLSTYLTNYLAMFIHI